MTRCRGHSQREGRQCRFVAGSGWKQKRCRHVGRRCSQILLQTISKRQARLCPHTFLCQSLSVLRLPSQCLYIKCGGRICGAPDPRHRARSAVCRGEERGDHGDLTRWRHPECADCVRIVRIVADPASPSACCCRLRDNGRWPDHSFRRREGCRVPGGGGEPRLHWRTKLRHRGSPPLGAAREQGGCYHLRWAAEAV